MNAIPTNPYEIAIAIAKGDIKYLIGAGLIFDPGTHNPQGPEPVGQVMMINCYDGDDPAARIFLFLYNDRGASDRIFNSICIGVQQVKSGDWATNFGIAFDSDNKSVFGQANLISIFPEDYSYCDTCFCPEQISPTGSSINMLSGFSRNTIGEDEVMEAAIQAAIEGETIVNYQFEAPEGWPYTEKYIESGNGLFLNSYALDPSHPVPSNFGYDFTGRNGLWCLDKGDTMYIGDTELTASEGCTLLMVSVMRMDGGLTRNEDTNGMYVMEVSNFIMGMYGTSAYTVPVKIWRVDMDYDIMWEVPTLIYESATDRSTIYFLFMEPTRFTLNDCNIGGTLEGMTINYWANPNPSDPDSHYGTYEFRVGGRIGIITDEVNGTCQGIYSLTKTIGGDIEANYYACFSWMQGNSQKWVSYNGPADCDGEQYNLPGHPIIFKFANSTYENDFLTNFEAALETYNVNPSVTIFRKNQDIATAITWLQWDSQASAPIIPGFTPDPNWENNIICPEF